MSEVIKQTPIRNAAWTVAEAAKLLRDAVQDECIEFPLKIKLSGFDVEVRQGYPPDKGWLINVRIGI